MNDRGALSSTGIFENYFGGLYAAENKCLPLQLMVMRARYRQICGRKAAAYVSQVSQPAISRIRSLREKARVYAPSENEGRHRVEGTACRHFAMMPVLLQRI